MLAVSQKIDIESDIIPGVATGLSGGMGLTGTVCGAVSGAVMSIGLVQGPAENKQIWYQNMTVIQEFRRRFEAEMKTIQCRELIGVDLTDPELFAEYIESETPKTVCVPAVDTAYRIVLELLDLDS
ncbi:C-GCAxxG-C-C family protein [Desulfovibrio sp. JC010]|uniref:C-GCAxxG-C-C family protein n=1 Tax=Desulfovibrio sp. JC010 TaxID=2593641 RepID=UPI001EF18E18|nr:C-GCAxxG-C-C family protein [Desulfovibrio sp. JC010]NDV27534.1 C_GCAxxG_C_C family protein [Desulfovibrio sp. JC010]